MANSKDTKKERKKLDCVEQYVVLTGNPSGYHVEQFMGKGCYGKVAKCTKLDTYKTVAVKILPKHRFRDGKHEVRILNKLRQLDHEKNNLVKFIEHFKFKGNICIVFEMLDTSIQEFIIRRNLAPLSLSEIRVISQQLIVALKALKTIGIVHADIKPDNIMLVDQKQHPFKVKLIDFGLATKTSKLWFPPLIQAIGYRAPEVILGLYLNESVDMWSLGCFLAYMYLGSHLYPIHCEYEAMMAIVHLHGQPQDDFLIKGDDTLNFFTRVEDSSDRLFRLNKPEEYTNATGIPTKHQDGIYKRLDTLDDLPKTRQRSTDLTECEDTQEFISLLKLMLAVNPRQRITPEDALCHNFITMRHLSGKGDDPYVASAFKTLRECHLNSVHEERYITPSEDVGRKSLPTPKPGGSADRSGPENEDESSRKVSGCRVVSQQKESGKVSTGKIPKDKDLNGKTIRSENSETFPAAKSQATFSKIVDPSALVEVKTRKKPFMRICKIFSRLFRCCRENKNSSNAAADNKVTSPGTGEGYRAVSQQKESEKNCKVKACSSNDAETEDNKDAPSGKSDGYTVLSQQKESKIKSKDEEWKGRTIIKVKSCYPADEETVDPAAADSSIARTSETVSAATSPENVDPSGLVEVKTCKKPFRRICKMVSRLFRCCREKK